MKNVIYKTVAAVLVVAMLLISFTTAKENRVYAADATLAISVSSSTVNLGDEFTVTVTFSSNVNSLYLSWILDFGGSSSIIEFLPTTAQSAEIADASLGVGVGLLSQKIDVAASEQRALTKTYRFRANAVGEVSFSLRNIENFGFNDGEDPRAIATEAKNASVNIVKRTLSSNANLSSLSTSVGTLTPAFSANVTEYRVEVANSAAVVYLYYSAADPDAKTSLAGADENLEVGDNRRVIVVTAPDGTVKRYTVNIVRAAAPAVTNTPAPSEKTPDAETPTTEPTETPAPPTETAPPTSAPDSVWMGDFNTVSVHYTVYDISIYLSSMENVPDVTYVAFMLGDFPCIGIPLYDIDTNSCFIVYAERENTGKFYYVYDTNDGSMQRYYGVLPSASEAPVPPSETPGSSETPGPAGPERTGNKILFFVIGFVGIAAIGAAVVAILFLVRKRQENEEDIAEDAEKFEEPEEPSVSEETLLPEEDAAGDSAEADTSDASEPEKAEETETTESEKESEAPKQEEKEETETK